MGILCFAVVLTGIGLYLFVMAYTLCYPILRPRRFSGARTLKPDQEIRCRTSDGCRLQAELYRTPYSMGRAVILLNGGRAEEDKIQWFIGRGYHVILFRQRIKRTLGNRERRDLRLIFTMTRRILGENCRIGTCGMGPEAVTALLHACIDDRVDFVIAEDAWSDPEELLKGRLRRRRYPAYPILWAADLLCRLRTGCFLREVSPEKEIEKRNGLMAVPVLFIAGDKNRVVPSVMSERLYEIKQGSRALYVCHAGGNRKNRQSDPVQYEQQLDAFLRENIREKAAI